MTFSTTNPQDRINEKINNFCDEVVNWTSGKYTDVEHARHHAYLVQFLTEALEEARVEELDRFRRAGFDPNKTLAQVLLFIDARIRELKSKDTKETSK